MFVLHLLVQVECVVGLEDREGIVGRPDDREHSLPKRRAKLESWTELHGHIGVHELLRRASAEQIDSFAAKLPCARAGEDKLLPGLSLDQQVHHFQQRRQLLDFVYENLFCRGVCSNHFDEVFGGGGIAAENRRVEQIDAQGIRVLMCAPGCLARPARSQKKVVIAPGSE